MPSIRVVRPARRVRRTLSACALSLLLAGSPAAAQQPLVPVPALTGLTLERTRAVLEAAQLTLGEVDTTFTTDDVGFEMVVGQRPAAGSRIPRGTAVGVTYRVRAPEMVTADPTLLQAIAGQSARVPDVRRLTIRAAARALERARLRLGPVDTAWTSDDVGLGVVVEQALAPGTTAQPGTRVGVTIRMRRTPQQPPPPLEVPVPSVLGRPLVVAQRILAGAGLTVGAVQEQDRFERPAGTVLVQRPAGGTVRAGFAVELWIASEWTEVPALAGLGIEAAGNALASRQLVPGSSRSESSDAPAGSILGQSPAPGTRVSKGSAVAVVFAQAAVTAPPGPGPALPPGPGPALPGDSTLVDSIVTSSGERVPSLIGLSLAEARARLDSAGLALVLGDAMRRTGLPAQVVAAQEPAANSPAPPDRIVRLRLAAAFPWAQVLGIAVIALTLATLAAPRIRAWLGTLRGAQREGAHARPPGIEFSPVIDDLTADLRSGTLVSSHALEMVAVLEDLRSQPVYADSLTHGGRDEH